MRRRWHADTLAESIAAIDVPELLATGVAGAIVDLDNTLVSYRSLEPTQSDAAWGESCIGTWTEDRARHE